MLPTIAKSCFSNMNRLFSLTRTISTTRRVFGVKPTTLKMPALSPTMTEGTIIKWLKKEGDAINPGDALCEIQTDKAVMALEVEEQGILAKIMMPDDSKDVKVGSLIALVVEEGEDWKDVEIPAEIVPPPSSAAETPKSGPEIKSATSADKHDISSKVGPATRHALDEFGIDVKSLKPTGPHGVLLKSDVLSYVEQQKLKPTAKTESREKTTFEPVPYSTPDESPFTDIPLTNMRLTIAKRLTESKYEIPHVYAAIDTAMDATIELRKSLLSRGTKVSLNDFIIKAVAVALQRVPLVNAQWIKDDIKLLSNIDISVAVATESGLITPIVKNAIGLGVSEISQTVKELADRAKKGKLKPDEFIGGSFTISNLGMFGISEFTAIINPPQSAILAVGTSRPVLDRSGWRTMMTSQMSYDGRVITAEVAAIFLEEFSNALNSPGGLLNSIDTSTFPTRRQLSN